MERINSGIIGLGFIGPAHIEALRRTGLSNVAAIADINAGVAASCAERLGIARAYTDYRQLLDDPQVDVVHICAPNYMHFEVAKAALEKGKHVICEKPLVTSLTQADELVALAKERKRVAAVSFNLRYYPLVQQARHMVRSGEIGRVFSYHGTYLQDWMLLETDYSWRLEPAISGPSRAFADIGSHWLDMAEYVSGKRVVSLCADLATFLPTRKKPLRRVSTFAKSQEDAAYEEVEISTEDYAGILFRFEDNVRGAVTISQTSAGRKNLLAFEIDGSEASLAWNSENPNELWTGRRDRPNGLYVKDPSLMGQPVAKYASFPGGHAEGFPDTTKQLFSEIYAYILRGGLEAGETPCFPTFEDGRREVRLCEAVLESYRLGSWVAV